MKEPRVIPTIRPDLVKDVLPEYFAEEYPNLVTFLESYYEFLGQDNEFGDIIKNLNSIRDINTNELQYLDHMFKEIGLGISQDFFSNPREVLRNFGRFFRVKGSIYSAEGFFRAFYGVDIEDLQIIYPKDYIFNVGETESKIGPNSGKVLQDAGLYQILSVLIKSPVSMGKWENLYRKYVHPAGFYLASEMQIEDNKGTGVIPRRVLPVIDPDLDIEDRIGFAEIKGNIQPCIGRSNIGNTDYIYLSGYLDSDSAGGGIHITDFDYNVITLGGIGGNYVEDGLIGLVDSQYMEFEYVIDEFQGYTDYLEVWGPSYDHALGEIWDDPLLNDNDVHLAPIDLTKTIQRELLKSYTETSVSFTATVQPAAEVGYPSTIQVDSAYSIAYEDLSRLPVVSIGGNIVSTFTPVITNIETDILTTLEGPSEIYDSDTANVTIYYYNSQDISPTSIVEASPAIRGIQSASFTLPGSPDSAGDSAAYFNLSIHIPTVLGLSSERLRRNDSKTYLTRIYYDDDNSLNADQVNVAISNENTKSMMFANYDSDDLADSTGFMLSTYKAYRIDENLDGADNLNLKIYIHSLKTGVVPPPPSLGTVFNLWERFSHNSSGVYPADSGQLSAWEYQDSPIERIICTQNTNTYVGFVSPNSGIVYSGSAELSSTSTDDDAVTLVIAYLEDSAGRQHTISAIRTAGGTFTDELDGWGIWYNYRQSDERELATYSIPFPGGNNWLNNGVTKVQFDRDSTSITAISSQFGSLVLDSSTRLTIDLTADSDLTKFLAPTSTGVGAYSQDQASFVNYQTDLLDELLVGTDLEVTGDIKIYFSNVYNSIYDWIKCDSTSIYDINNFNPIDINHARDVTLNEILQYKAVDLKDIII